MLSYIEISKKNLFHNFRAMKSLVKPGVKIAAVIKANAYGHGQNIVAKILEKEADYFQVDDIEELRSLRQVSKKKILVFGYVSKNELAEALKLKGILCVYNKDQILSLNAVAKKIKKKAIVHIKIDAALGRQGVLLKDFPEIIKILKKCKNIIVDGVYAHFANIEDTTDFSHAQKQLEIFNQAIKIFQKNEYKNFKTHISASSGVMVYENNEGKSELIRLGISLYGMWPSEDLRKRFEKQGLRLKAVMRWVTHVAQVKILPKNHYIGYGLTYVTKKPTKVAIIPQGYSDGYDRGLSNKGEVLIQGQRCSVLGRVAMNMFVVDVTHIKSIKNEDEVVLLGRQGKEEVTAEELAKHLGTINYEITTRITPLLKRVVK
ncbi:MAG TPA: alanine racemase [Candidatus Moranbacteria bacterium]|nr:alanine racemase [Candidatus Moranbacteria bacterium]HRZ33613.1 alanine racemase [Candidatus Moranbacteria bacterium]